MGEVRGWEQSGGRVQGRRKRILAGGWKSTVACPDRRCWVIGSVQAAAELHSPCPGHGILRQNRTMLTTEEKWSAKPAKLFLAARMQSYVIGWSLVRSGEWGQK